MLDGGVKVVTWSIATLPGPKPGTLEDVNSASDACRSFNFPHTLESKYKMGSDEEAADPATGYLEVKESSCWHEGPSEHVSFSHAKEGKS